MLTQTDKDAIRNTASKYSANRVFLFNADRKPCETNDNIGIAVEGIDPKNFFKFYGDLLFNVSKPFDIVDTLYINKYFHTVPEKGMVIYDKSSPET